MSPISVLLSIGILLRLCPHFFQKTLSFHKEILYSLSFFRNTTFTSPVLEKFKANFPFSTDKWDEYVSKFERIQVPAKTILLRAGEVSRKAYLIEKGCLRVWFDNNGEDTTFQFFFENNTVSSIESFSKNLPSHFNIETIEPCTLWRIDKADINPILEEAAEIKSVRHQIADAMLQRTLHYMEHFLSFIRDTPEERYRNLVAQRPYIVQRVPQHYIASYLGVSTVHLSRIKSKIAKKG